MSAFERTPLAFALRDCGITAPAVAGIAMEIGIEPTARHAADLGIIPVVIEDACRAGHAAAAQRSCEALRFAGDAIMTRRVLRRAREIVSLNLSSSCCSGFGRPVSCRTRTARA